MNSGQVWLCGLRLNRAAPHTNKISRIRTSQSWAYPAHPRASGFREGTGSTLASRQTPACARWLHQPSQYLCPQCWRQACWECFWGSVPNAVLPATLSVPKSAFSSGGSWPWVPDALSAQGRSSLLRTMMGNSLCRDFSSNCTFHTKSFG